MVQLPNVKQIIVLALLGGFVFLILGFLTTAISDFIGDLSGIIVPILLMIVFLSFAAKVRVDDLNISRLAVLLVGISVVAALIEMIVPGFGLILPTTGVFGDVYTLLLVVTSLTVGESIARMFGLQ